MTHIGIIRETKNPPDRRVPLNPAQCRALLDRYLDLDITVQPSAMRCFSDDEYRQQGIRLEEDLSGCDVLLGVKEVKLEALIDGKTYFFFSHTAKEQPYNRPLLQEVVRRGITLIDYEYLTDGQARVVAFGRWAGIVGAYNGLRGVGVRSGRYQLKPAHECFDLREVLDQLAAVDLGNLRFIVTGGGRVALGALEILDAAGLVAVNPEDFLAGSHDGPIYARLDPWHYTRRGDGEAFEFEHFIAHPDRYENALTPYLAKTDVLVACHYWDPRSPQMVTREQLAGGQLPLQLVADISCDILEPIATTLRPSTIASPFYGYDPSTGGESGPFDGQGITVMAVDNLPGELPRDAASDFGEALIDHVVPEILGLEKSDMLARATIAAAGQLTEPYSYLQGFLEGR